MEPDRCEFGARLWWGLSIFSGFRDWKDSALKQWAGECHHRNHRNHRNHRGLTPAPTNVIIHLVRLKHFDRVFSVTD